MKQYTLLSLLILCYFESHAQETTSIPVPEWNGDPKVCTVDPSAPIINDKPLPTFPNQAEFTLERVEVRHIMNITLPSELTIYQYLYDFYANKLILIKNANGLIDIEYFYYEILKKSIYYRGQFCIVTDIPTNVDGDGLSAIQTQTGTWHIRPLNEFLLFSSNDPRRPQIRPTYIGQDLIRGIPVDIWESCIISKPDFRTVRRRWAFAQKGYSMPAVPQDDTAIPVQANISASVVFPNGTQALEFDEIFNVHAYRAGIIESSDQLAPPKGVFCNSGSGQNLVSLRDVGVSWPNRFSVRVEASSSRTAQWQRFHLRYDQGRDGGSRRIRYDYMPPGAEDFESVIHDYTDNLTYIIDRRVGTCRINRGTQIPDVNPIRDPIRFFIKNEAQFIFNPPEKAWEFNGVRSCRGSSIKCTILTTSLDNYPVIVESDTDIPTGETWAATNVEYGWSIRAPLNRPPPNVSKHFDYPVSLYLKMYRFEDPNYPSPFNIRTEDLEYEFYEMSHDSNPSDFDTSICYRSLDMPYLHLGFVLKPSNNSLVDSKYLNRRALERNLRIALTNGLQVRLTRVSDIELDHIRFDNSVYVLFTLLGPVPLLNNDEPSVEQAQQLLETKINADQFTFNTTLLDNDASQVIFKAQPNSLKVSKQFMSIHASWIYANLSNCNASNTNFTNTNGSNCPVSNVNNSHTNGQRITQEKYASAALAGSVIGGLLVGIVLGFIALGLNRFLYKTSKPGTAPIIGGGLSNASYRQKNPASPLSMQTLQDAADKSHD